MLLSVLAYLQYSWLGQIAGGERERLQRNLQTDTQRFADDFNREIQSAYFNFQLSADVWREQKWSDFNERYKFYTEKTIYPNLIKAFYFAELGENKQVLRYNKETQAFETAELPPPLANLQPKLSSEEIINPVAEEIPALLMPVHETNERFERILIRKIKPENAVQTSPPEIPAAKKYGVLIIELDENVIKTQLFPDLVKKYFSESDGANYNLTVLNKEKQMIFGSQNLTATDSSAKLFDLSADNFMFFANREMISSIQGEKRKSVVFSRVESRNLEEKKSGIQPESEFESRYEVQVKTKGQPRIRVFESKNSDADDGSWTLNVQHNAGSLEQFVADTRRKNLAVSFGILSLLAVSIVLIFLSAQRAKMLAQRQINFVSSVSHEFRTPLAVIYSAGENLADGVAKEERQVSRYGDLIKGEGRKLSKMVEQILDFAGANSGKKKYDLRETDVAEIIKSALAECDALLREKNFAVEIEIAETLPKILADKDALVQAVQNLIANSVKYSGGENFIKISAGNGGGKIKIAVEDKGIGIAKADLKHIFEPFYRAKAVVDEQIHGSGLGLSLVRETVEKHGGKISAESETGKGSRFVVHLPFIV